MFDEMIRRKKLIPERLISYGFTKDGEYFKYFTEIMNGAFTLAIQIGADDTIETNLTEKETGEEYILYKTNASGAYVGEIRLAIEQVIGEIVENCYEPEIFKTAQAQMVIEFVREAFLMKN